MVLSLNFLFFSLGLILKGVVVSHRGIIYIQKEKNVWKCSVLGAPKEHEMIKLRIYRRKDGSIAYAPGILFRAMCIAFFAIVAVGIALNVADQSPWYTMILPVFLALVTLAGASYREEWYFDPKKQTVTSIFGVACFTKKEVIPYADISRLEINHFVRGSVPGFENGQTSKVLKPNKRRNKAMVVFTIRLKDNEMRDIEIIPEKTSQGRTEQAAQAIAAVSGLALVVDRPRDMDTNVSLHDI